MDGFHWRPGFQTKKMTTTEAEVEAGQAVYSPAMLGIYDWLVLKFSNHLIWRCPSKYILFLYNQHVTGNHLDVGVGTGYFLDRCRFPNEHPRLCLMDLNPNCLHVAGTRLSRYDPEAIRANALDPIGSRIAPFDSISLTYLLHCLLGTIRTKTAVFHHLKLLLNPGGVIFGATLLSEGVYRNWAAKRLMAFYNSKGIFANNHDDLASLRAVLTDHFARVHLDVVGCAALFSGRI